VHYLRKEGATTVAVIAASFGGVAAAAAAVEEPGSIDRLVLLGATPEPPDEKLVTRKPLHRHSRRCQRRRAPAAGPAGALAKAPEPNCVRDAIVIRHSIAS
jgi:pimeloyl-ACP methyl ester carboxylesterase